MYLFVLHAQVATSLGLGLVAMDTSFGLPAFFYGFAGHVLSIALGIVGLVSAPQRAAIEFAGCGPARRIRIAALMSIATVNGAAGATLGWAAMHGPGLDIAGNSVALSALMGLPLVLLLNCRLTTHQSREAT